MAFKMNRRTFLKSTTLAAASLPLSKIASAENEMISTPLRQKGTASDKTMYGGVCEMCFWRCQIVGKVREGRLVKLEGNPKSIDNGTAICARGNAGVQLMYDPDRLKYPLKNVGRRGAPKWKRISWKEALDECGQRLNRIKKKYGPHGIAMFPHGASAKYPMHFFERTVGTENVSEASFFQCRGIRDTAYIATIGTAPGEHVDLPNTKVMFFLGCHLGENVHVSHLKRYLKGLANGAKLIVVDPRYSAAAAKADIWVPIKPGTDTAFLLAIMNHLIVNKQYDADFVDEYTDGLSKLTKEAAKWPLEKAAKVCDIKATQIKEVAELLAAHSPNVAIHPGRHVSWHGNDFQRQRGLACLMGLLGSVGVKGGFVKPKGPKVKGISWAKGEHDDEYNLKELAEKYHYAPPGTPTDLIRNTCVTGDPYPIKGCVIWGQNPIQTIPNQALTIKALEQMDFVMCVDVMPTDITMYADILLPECSYLERYDIIKTGTQWDFSDKHQQFIAPRMPLVEPMFERKDSIWITNELAKRMGYEDKIPVKNQEEKLEKELSSVQLSIDQIKKEKGIHLRPGKDPYGISEDFELLFFNEDLVDNGYPGVPTYIPVEEVPPGYARLVYGRSPLHTFNRSQNNIWLHNAMPTNPIWINDEVAEKLGLKDGYYVSLVNSEGVESTGTSVIKVTPGIRKDTIYMAHGYGSKNPMMNNAYHAGIDDTELITKLAVDPETGAHGMRNNFVKIKRKSGKVQDIPT